MDHLKGTKVAVTEKSEDSRETMHSSLFFCGCAHIVVCVHLCVCVCECVFVHAQVLQVCAGPEMYPFLSVGRH